MLNLILNQIQNIFDLNVIFNTKIKYMYLTQLLSLINIGNVKHNILVKYILILMKACLELSTKTKLNCIKK